MTNVKKKLRREEQRQIKRFVSLCKSCLKLIDRMHVKVKELQTIVPDLFSVRSYPGETVPLSPSEIVQRFQEDKPPHIDTEAYNLNREDTEIHALVFTVVQIYSVVGFSHRDTLMSGNMLMILKKNGMCSQI